MSDKQRNATPKKAIQVITHAKQDTFLEDFAVHGNVTLACKAADIERSTLYRWKEKSDTFLIRYNQAFEEAKDNIRAEIYRRGHDGVNEPLMSQGQVVYGYEPALDANGNQMYDSKGKPVMKRGAIQTVTKYSDTLLIFHAKMLMPEYREKSSVDLNATVQGNLTHGLNIDTRGMSSQGLQEMKEWAAREKARQEERKPG